MATFSGSKENLIFYECWNVPFLRTCICDYHLHSHKFVRIIELVMVSYKRFFLTDKSISQVQALLRPIPRQQIHFKCFSVIHIIADIIYTTSKHFWKSGNGSKIHLKSHMYHADVSRSLWWLYNSVMEQQNTLKRTTDTLKNTDAA